MQKAENIYIRKVQLSQQVPAKVKASRFYQKKLLVILACLMLLKTFVAFTLELGNDESYYWLYSQQLKWNYFDHPPMIALWVRFFSANLWLQHFEGFLRLGSLVGGVLATIFLFKAVSAIHSPKAGLIAACLYNASFYAGLTAGLFITPDTPQMVFWTFSLWMIARICANENNWTNWLLLGLAAGLCIMSKVHGVFIPGGLGLFVLLKKRTWLKKPQLYAAFAIALLLASPILFWNIQHEFVTYRFHSQRVSVQQLAFNSYSFFKEIAYQVGFNNPFNVALVLAGLAAWQGQKITHYGALSVYNFIGLPLAGVLLVIAVFRNSTLPHWSGPAYITLLPLAAIRLAVVNRSAILPKAVRWSLGTFVMVVVGWWLSVHFYPGTTGSKQMQNLGEGDITLDQHGWPEAGKAFAALYQSDIKKGIVAENTPLVSYKWWGAHVEYYFARPLGIQMMGLGNLHELHEYMWHNKIRKDKVNFSSAYCIMPSDEYYNVAERYQPYYSRIQQIATIDINRGGKPAHRFYIYRLTGWQNNLPQAQ